MLILSGGNEGGSEVDGAGWAIGDDRVINGAVYRRVSEDQAVFAGLA